MVGLVENALIEIRDKYRPDRIIIESSGSAFPATLALQIRQLEPEGFKLDGVVTVIDCVNFRGYEDTSPTAKVCAYFPLSSSPSRRSPTAKGRLPTRDCSRLGEPLPIQRDPASRTRVRTFSVARRSFIWG